MPSRSSARGFTLIELMVVVVIIGILGTLAVYAVRNYVLAAKSSEAVEIIQSIKAAQEAYKDETFTYKNLTADLDTLYPIEKGDLGNKKVQWGGGEGAAPWREIGVTPSAPVQFGYACVAKNGGSLSGVPTELNYPSSPTGWWYVIQALGDRDEDGEHARFIASSFTDEIYSENDTE